VLEHGAQSHRLIKVPVDELARWDATHDAVGRLIVLQHGTNESSGKPAESAVSEKVEAGRGEGMSC
jgi:hypothetical protein